MARRSLSTVLGVAAAALTSAAVYAATTTNPLAVVTTSGNSGTSIERSECVTIGIVKDVANQCGALRIVHPLPSVRTHDKERQIALLYNSDQAAPAILNVDIALASGQSAPTSVRTTLYGINYLNQEELISQRTDAGSAWSSSAQRVGLKLPEGSGLLRYRVKVDFLIGGSWTSAATPVDGEQALVGGTVGRGWRVSGVERLYLGGDRILWIGGDGSTRAYVGTNRTTAQGWEVWAVESGRMVRPESLIVTTLEGDLWEIVRNVPGGGRVVFDPQGKHIRTVGRLGEETRLVWGTLAAAGLVPDSIIMPGGLSYTFVGGKQTGSFEARSPSAVSGQSKLTRVNFTDMSNGWASSIEDPDTTTVSFTTDSSGRIISRADRRGTSTSFTYESNAATLAGATTAIENSQTAAHTFVSAQGRAATTSATTALAVARRSSHDGPLSTGDTTTFWVNRVGALDSVRNALGQVTKLTRDTGFVLRVTQVVRPSGMTTNASYDTRGNIASTTEVNPYGNSQNATTTYEWDSIWDQVTKIKRPEGDSIVQSIDASTGTVTWAQTGGNANRVYFYYYTTTSGVGDCARRYKASVNPGFSERDSVAYGPLCNTARVHSHTGVRKVRVQNSIGQDTLHADVIPSYTESFRSATLLTYTTMGRPRESIMMGVPTSYYVQWSGYSQGVPGDTLLTRNYYDEEGNVTRVLRNAGKTTETNQSDVSSHYTFDKLNRKVSDSTSGSGMVYLRYDRVGNLLRRVSPLGDSLSMEYDVLNRLTRRVEPARSHAATACSLIDTTSGQTCSYTLPRSGNALVVSADTAVFSYDVDGNMTRADNRFARVRRGYYANGLVKADTLLVRTMDSSSSGSSDVIGGMTSPGRNVDFTPHTYVLNAKYDRNGRRVRLSYPSFMTACGGSCNADSLTFNGDGRISQVIDGRGGTYQHYFSAAGDLDSLSYPNSVKVRTTYDADGRATQRSFGTSGLSYSVENLSYDDRGLLSSISDNLMSASTTLTYSSGGALVGMNYYVPSTGFVKSEEFRTDAIGQRYWSRSHNSAIGTTPTYSPKLDANGRLKSTYGSGAGRWYQYFADGSTRFVTTAGTSQEAMYYGANGKMRFFERRKAQITYGNDSGPNHGLSEEYRYDALGRRVLLISQHQGNCTSARCESVVQRFVWDGQRLAGETRSRADLAATTAQIESDTASGDGVNGTPATYGRVWYTNTLGIDRPLAILRIGGGTGADSQAVANVISVYPHLDARNQYNSVTYSSGANPLAIHLPAATATTFRAITSEDGPPVAKASGAWAGTVLSDQNDNSGFSYRRSRYYDPSSGRFTQVDPIGVRGGLGVYAFAGGDPINYADPFGTCPCAAAIGYAYAAAAGSLAAIGAYTASQRDAIEDALEGIGAWLATGARKIKAAIREVLPKADDGDYCDFSEYLHDCKRRDGLPPNHEYPYKEIVEMVKDWIQFWR